MNDRINQTFSRQWTNSNGNEFDLTVTVKEHDYEAEKIVKISMNGKAGSFGEMTTHKNMWIVEFRLINQYYRVAIDNDFAAAINSVCDTATANCAPRIAEYNANQELLRTMS
jgi:ABC-type uncharacterized transport system ATPase component